MKKVIKKDLSIEDFSNDKFNKWAKYADQTGAIWNDIALKTYSRLPENVTSEEIHETMINVCIEEEEIKASRMAARLVYAKIRKGLNSIGISDRDNFSSIMDKMFQLGVWDKDSLIQGTYALSDFENLDSWYEDLRSIRCEYWTLQKWCSSYTIDHDGVVIETPAMGVFAIAISIFGINEEAYAYAKYVLKGVINLPTPVINGCRNGDFDTISCCVISGGDTVESIGVADHIAYRMTAKQAGIGIEMNTRSIGDKVRGGAVEHLGKSPIYESVNASVKMFTQVGRGGSATMTFSAVDPQIEHLLLLKTQRLDLEQRIDKMDYSFAFNDAFMKAVITKSDWHLFSYADAPHIVRNAFYNCSADVYEEAVHKAISEGVPHKTVKALDILKTFLTARQETGRIYAINVSRVNEHTPFLDTIFLSNLCQEINLPTKPYEDMLDLYVGNKFHGLGNYENLNPVSKGETAFCSLSAANVSKLSGENIERVYYLIAKGINILIDKAPMMTPTMEESIKWRRSIGVGITGLAGALYKEGLDYDGSQASLEKVNFLAEQHYYYLLKASQRLVSEGLYKPVEGINRNWLPVDTRRGNMPLNFDWEAIRGLSRANSVLCANMPCESSSQFSGAENGVYPIREPVMYKQSRRGIIQFIATPGHKMAAWDVSNIELGRVYSLLQDWCDQSTSADTYTDYRKYPGGKVPMSTLLRDFISMYKMGMKTWYYVNSNDDNGGSIQEEKGCSSGFCDV